MKQMVTKKNQNNYDLTNFVTEGNDVTQSYIKGPSVPNHNIRPGGFPVLVTFPFVMCFWILKQNLPLLQGICSFILLPNIS